MSKIRIYLKPSEIKDSLSISDREVIHKIKDVLRLKISARLYLFDGCGKEYIYSIQELTKKSVLLKKEKLAINSPAPNRRMTLAFPLEREERVDFILQKATELAVWQFIPFTSQRSIQAKPSIEKVKRWQRIIVEAARQSERLWIPEIESTQSFKDICDLNYDLKLVGSLHGKPLDKKLVRGINNILIAIGPVGDFSKDEYSQLQHNGFKAMKLSQNLLRTETAAIFSVGLINHYLDES